MFEPHIRSIDGIEKTNSYKIVPRIIKHSRQHRRPLHLSYISFGRLNPLNLNLTPLRIPVPPRMRIFKPMLTATILVICLVTGWSGLIVLANRQLALDGSDYIDITNIPFPGEDEMIGPIPFTTGDPDMHLVAAAFFKLLSQSRELQVPNAELAGRVEQLRTYLASKQSPLASDDQALRALATAHNTRMILAISFVESNFCRHQLDFNCSGIGGSSKFRRYANFAEWVVDFDNLLDRRYKGLDPEDLKGDYVKPGSDNWVRGIHQILAELKARGIS